MALLPYNPTRVFSDPSVGLVYIFEPHPDSYNARLLAFNVTTTTTTDTDVPFSTVSSDLPFLKDGNAFIPTIDPHGNISVFTGGCNEDPDGASLWIMREPHASLQSNGSWQELELSTTGVDQDKGLKGANHLAAGVSFAVDMNSTASLHIFGGMCPLQKSSSPQDWTHSANYSNSVLSLQPSEGPSTSDHLTYQLEIPRSRGPPVPEAGFTVTALKPSSSSSDNQETEIQSQNFVLLGGHTDTAFINMSQIALYSLPEQSWTFLAVDPPSIPSTDLARRDLVDVDSRSGHSAVLTPDGKKIIIFGGWVGDVTQAAEPQLAILETGTGYGGLGNWRWIIPNLSGNGPAAGSGIYGHGAALLPDDIMMITGGYDIPATPSSRRKRQQSGAGSKTYFLNTTSNTWVSSYKHPSANDNRIHKATGASSRSAEKAGLGAGLTFGILAIIAAVIVLFWYSRRLKRKREKREEELRRLAEGAQKLHLTGPSLSDNRRTTSEMATVDRPESLAPSRSLSQNSRSEPEAERTGLLFEIPSPTRGLRRSLHSRGIYQPAPRYDNGRRTPDFSTIHPIDERDEYEEEESRSGRSAYQETIQKKDFDLLSNVPVLNPFQDPTEHSRSPSPQSPQQRENEIRRWVNDWTAADALLHQSGGRLSPEKTDRTSSTLSDQSARSLLSTSSWQPSMGTVSRTMSQRSAALFNAMPFRSTADTTPLEFPSQSAHSHRRSNSAKMYAGPDRAVETPTSFTTAKTSWNQHHTENDAAVEEESSPTRLQAHARGFMGSLRRAFTGDRSSSASPEHVNSTSSSPVKSSHPNRGSLHRTASTGGVLWKARQGAKDWDAEAAGQRSGEVSKGHEEEWDVESAVQNRVVQVMFTVPKDKLRVVNRGDEDGASIVSSTDNMEVIDSNEKSSNEAKGKQVEK